MLEIKRQTQERFLNAPTKAGCTRQRDRQTESWNETHARRRTLVRGDVLDEEDLWPKLALGVFEIDVGDDAREPVDVQVLGEVRHRRLVRLQRHRSRALLVPREPVAQEAQDLLEGEGLLPQLLHHRERDQKLAKVAAGRPKNRLLLAPVNVAERVPVDTKKESRKRQTSKGKTKNTHTTRAEG